MNVLICCNTSGDCWARRPIIHREEKTAFGAISMLFPRRACTLGLVGACVEHD